MAQRDPLVEYQREGFRPVRGHDGRHQGGVGRLPVQLADEGDEDEDGMPSAPDPLAGTAFSRATPGVTVKGLEQNRPAARLHYSAPSESGAVEHRDVEASGDSVPNSGGYRRPTPRRSSKKARRRGK
jgi:preprotein translocase subunit SecA